MRVFWTFWLTFAAWLCPHALRAEDVPVIGLPWGHGRLYTAWQAPSGGSIYVRRYGLGPNLTDEYFGRKAKYHIRARDWQEAQGVMIERERKK